MSTINHEQKTKNFQNPLRDGQQERPAAWCRNCRGEIYPLEAEKDGTFCPQCGQERKNKRKRKREMTLIELSKEYRAQAQVLRVRITQLQEQCADIENDVERLCMDDRIKMLETMWRETRDLAVFTERYYDWGYRRNAKYTI